jgi:hypothetical protein
MSITNLTPTNINQVKQLLEITNTNSPNTPTWTDAENQLEELLWSFDEAGGLKSTRLKYYSSGIFDLIIPIILSEPGKHTNDVLEGAWSLINRGMGTNDVNEQDNIETITKGVELGFIELAVRELRFRPLRYGGKLMYRASLAVLSPAGYGNFTNHVISSGVLAACLDLIRDGGDLENAIDLSNLDTVISVLNNITRFNPTSIRILPNLAEAVQPYLPLLTRQGNDDILMLGFSAAKLLIRLYGKDESSKVIAENPVILDFYPKIMRELMDVGAARNYLLYNSYWKLGGVALDLSLISMSDTNKQLLVPVVPLMLEMMVLHHNSDRSLLRFGLVFLSQIVLDDSCLVELQKDKERRMKAIQSIILSDKEQDKETLSLLKVVMNVVFPSAS